MSSLYTFNTKGFLTLSNRILTVVNAVPGAGWELKLYNLLTSVDSESFITQKKTDTLPTWT